MSSLLHYHFHYHYHVHFRLHKQIDSCQGSTPHAYVHIIHGIKWNCLALLTGCLADRWIFIYIYICFCSNRPINRPINRSINRSINQNLSVNVNKGMYCRSNVVVFAVPVLVLSNSSTSCLLDWYYSYSIVGVVLRLVLVHIPSYPCSYRRSCSCP